MKADLQTNIANLYEGEVVYATDEERLFVVEGGVLVAVTAGAATGDVMNTNINNAVAGQALIYNNGQWRNGGRMDGGNF